MSLIEPFACAAARTIDADSAAGCVEPGLKMPGKIAAGSQADPAKRLVAELGEKAADCGSDHFAPPTAIGKGVQLSLL